MTIAAALTAARTLVRMGYFCFPCGRHKRPTCPHGFQDAVVDPDQLEDLWHRHPGQLVGVATGAKSGISVLDIDKKHRPAHEWWAAHRDRLLPTRVHRTRSGGLHLIFRHREGIRNSEGIIAKGIDTRGEGGYCIWWPSAGFQVLSDPGIQAWPEWLTVKAPSLVLPPPSTMSRRAIAARDDLRPMLHRAKGILRTMVEAAGGRTQSRTLLGGMSRPRYVCRRRARPSFRNAGARPSARGRRKSWAFPTRNRTHDYERLSIEGCSMNEIPPFDAASLLDQLLGDRSKPEAPRLPLEWLDMSGWDSEPVPERKWAIKDRVPLNQAGLFSGEGGTGKSIIELKKNVAHVAGKDWFGSLPEPGPAFYIGAEDDKDEIHIRLAVIAKHYDVTFKDLGPVSMSCACWARMRRCAPSAGTARSRPPASIDNFTRPRATSNRRTSASTRCRAPSPAMRSIVSRSTHSRCTCRHWRRWPAVA